MNIKNCFTCKNYIKSKNICAIEAKKPLEEQTEIIKVNSKNAVLPDKEDCRFHSLKDTKSKANCNCKELNKIVLIKMAKKYLSFDEHLLFIDIIGEIYDPKTLAIAKARGFVKGKPDFLLLQKNRAYDGIAIEFKKDKYDKLRVEQADTMEALRKQNILCVVEYDYNSAYSLLSNYLLCNCKQCSKDCKSIK